jgi:flagellar hook-basal body complex protein FliE
MISPLVATRAYEAVQGSAVSGRGLPIENEATGAASGPSFAQVLQGAVTDAISSSHTAERQIQAQQTGRADLVNVVTAVASAQASLETVMAVRDQVIAAYQEILKMPI